MSTFGEPRRMSDFLQELMDNPQTPEDVRRKSSLFLETLPVNTLDSLVTVTTPVLTPIVTPVSSGNDHVPSTRIVIKQDPPTPVNNTTSLQNSQHLPSLQPSPVYANNTPPILPEAGMQMYPPITDFILQELARNPAFAMQVASMFLQPQQQQQQQQVAQFPPAMTLPMLPTLPQQQQQQFHFVPQQFDQHCTDDETHAFPPTSPSPEHTIVAQPVLKPVVHAPGEAYILIRGARKSVFADLNAIQELNSLPYKYCFKLVLPFLNDKDYHAKVNSDNIKMELLCVDSATQESVVENGITMEKLMRTKRYADRRELEYKVYLSAYSHGFNKNTFIVKVFDSQTGHVIMRSQTLPIFARRNQSAQPQGDGSMPTKKRKRESSQEANGTPSKKAKSNSNKAL